MITTTYVLQSEKIPESQDGICFAVLADLHDGELGRRGSELEEAIRAAAPDAILIAGDMVQARYHGAGHYLLHFRHAAGLLRRLARRYPVYYANGNHETRWKHFRVPARYSFAAYRQELRRAGVIFLENHSLDLTGKAAGIRLTGLEFPEDRKCKTEIPSVSAEDIRGYVGPADPDRYQILLGHSPQFFDAYRGWGADLTLAGHFHGGIVRLPFLGGVISPYMRLFPKYDRGLFTEAGRSMAVSAGLGAHTIHLRINNPEELVILRLYHQRAQTETESRES